MRSKAVVVARVLLGLIFFVFGLNGFLQWFPLPAMKGAATEFMGGLVASGYFLPLLFGTNTITGAALLTGRFVPLALTVLAPVIVNIVAVHLFLDPSGFPLTILVVVLELFLAWSYRAAFLSLLSARNDAAPAH
jgi:uncharacterized membrane protein YphA (DoxX/SURF4 family)